MDVFYEDKTGGRMLVHEYARSALGVGLELEAKRFNITMKDEIPMLTTERAYTSPIWYAP